MDSRLVLAGVGAQLGLEKAGSDSVLTPQDSKESDY